MATVSADLTLHPHGGESLTLADQVTMFHLVAVVLDPYTYESSWLLDTAGRILTNFSGADARTALILTSDVDGAREFVGPWADRDAVVGALIEAGEKRGMVRVGGRAYLTNTLESGWLPRPLPAFYSGEGSAALVSTRT